MKHLLFILIGLIYLQLRSQVINYAISNSSGLNSVPYKIYDAKDGNILLSNGEINWDSGYSHLLKVTPNGDTIFIKSSNASDIFVTSTGNIITNEKYFDILTTDYTSSSLSLYDKNFIKKWEIDLTNYSIYNTGYDLTHGFCITSIFEKNSNHYMAFANTVIGTLLGPQYGKIIFNFDSLGNILSNNFGFGHINSKNQVLNNTKEIGFDIGNFIGGYNTYDLLTKKMKLINHSNDSIQFSYKDGVFVNDKLYITGTISNITDTNQVYRKGFIMSVDTNTNVNWFKTIIPLDSTINNEIIEIENINNNIICKYNNGNDTYILNIDTNGLLIQSNQIPNYYRVTNFTLLNNNIYTSALNSSSPTNFISMIKMNTDGTFFCSNNSSLNMVDFSMASVQIITLNTNILFYPTSTFTTVNSGTNTYTVNISAECGLTTDIENQNVKNNFDLFPNPNNGIFELVNSDSDKYQSNKIIIYNTLGIEIKSIKNSTIKQIDISQFANGVYYLSVYKNERLLETKKIIKQ